MTTGASDPNKCRIYVYANENFEGKCLRLFGPARYPNMRIEGHDLTNEIDSIKIGANAYVRCYDDELFESTLLWLLPGQEIPRLSDYGFGDRIDSIEIFDHPPRPHERGYEEYIKAVEGKNGGVEG